MDGTKWEQTELPYLRYWRSVCYGKDKFIAIYGNAYGESYIAYSSDGETWAEVTAPALSHVGCKDICYGNDKFVTVGSTSATKSNGRMAYSIDDITVWHVADNHPDGNYASVCYGNNMFVAIASNKAVYSFVGKKWPDSPIPLPSGYWQSICYGNGKFVAVDYDSNRAAYSTNAIQWDTASLPSSGSHWSSVCYGKDKFVAVSTGGKITYSTDGTNWQDPPISLSGNWSSVCYGNGKFVVIAYSDNQFTYSENGIDNWAEPQSLPVTLQRPKICSRN